MKALIIDDERKARNVLRILIEENCLKITEISEAEDLLSGVELIKSVQPRIVFLDIEMPVHSGLEILDFINKETYNFEIVFTTAYSEHAIQAFQLSAIDYLLKPIKQSELKKSVEKVLSFLGNTEVITRLESLKQIINSGDFNKIGLPFSDGIRFVNFKDIIMLEANGAYCEFSLRSGETLLISKPLKHFAELISDLPQFFRTHRSFLINIKYVQEYIKKDGGYIKMDNGAMVSLSKERRDDFLAIIQSMM